MSLRILVAMIQVASLRRHQAPLTWTRIISGCWRLSKTVKQIQLAVQVIEYESALYLAFRRGRGQFAMKNALPRQTTSQ
jgi:hypothetical protein